MRRMLQNMHHGPRDSSLRVLSGLSFDHAFIKCWRISHNHMPSHVLDQFPYPAAPVIPDVVVSITSGLFGQRSEPSMVPLGVINNILSGKLLDREQGLPQSFNEVWRPKSGQEKMSELTPSTSGGSNGGLH